MTETPATETTNVTTETAETFSADYVKSLRDEAAGYRVKNKEDVDAAKVTTRSEVIGEYEPQLAERDTQIADLTQSVTEKDLEIQKLRAVITAKVPVEDIDTVYGLVQGTDEETISDSVKRVMSIYGKTPAKVPATDPSQGSGGSQIPLNGSPLLLALKRAVGAE